MTVRENRMYHGRPSVLRPAPGIHNGGVKPYTDTPRPAVTPTRRTQHSSQYMLDPQFCTQYEERQIELADLIINLYEELQFEFSQETDDELRTYCIEFEDISKKLSLHYEAARNLQPPRTEQFRTYRPGQGFPGPQHQTEGFGSANRCEKPAPPPPPPPKQY